MRWKARFSGTRQAGRQAEQQGGHNDVPAGDLRAAAGCEKHVGDLAQAPVLCAALPGRRPLREADGGVRVGLDRGGQGHEELRSAHARPAGEIETRETKASSKGAAGQGCKLKSVEMIEVAMLFDDRWCFTDGREATAPVVLVAAHAFLAEGSIDRSEMFRFPFPCPSVRTAVYAFLLFALFHARLCRDSHQQNYLRYDTTHACMCVQQCFHFWLCAYTLTMFMDYRTYDEHYMRGVDHV